MSINIGSDNSTDEGRIDPVSHGLRVTEYNTAGVELSTIQNAILNTIATNTGTQSTDTLVTGTISALNGVVTVNGQGAYTITALITGTWVGTLIAEGLMADGVTWTQLPMYIINTTTLPYLSTTSLILQY
jgi:hypothetical protein